MNILYIGAGFVGACSAAVSAGSGHNVLVYDIDADRIKKLRSYDRAQIESCLFEDGLSDLLVHNRERVKFTDDYNLVRIFLDSCQAVFMCLNTPEIGETGESDLSYYYTAAKKLAANLFTRNNTAQSQYVVIVNKSTVPIDMMDQTERLMKDSGVINFGVVSNPEFLVEGKAISGSIKPDRIVIGASSSKDFEIMRELYQRFYGSPTVKYIEVNPKEAAAGKLLANYMLFNRVAVCFDVVGRVSESFADLQIENLRSILSSDPRLGGWGLFDSLYAGGSCFIKDSRSLAYQLKQNNHNCDLIDGVLEANRRQLNLFLRRPEEEANFDWEGKTVAIMGLAFKRDTNDIRNSPSIEIVNFLLEKNVHEINIYDPAATDNFLRLFQNIDKIKSSQNEGEAVATVDVVIIVTDWPQFRELSELIKSRSKKNAMIMDGRRMLQHAYLDLQIAGHDIVAVGSPFIKGKK